MTEDRDIQGTGIKLIDDYSGSLRPDHAFVESGTGMLAQPTAAAERPVDVDQSLYGLLFTLQ